MQESGGLVFAMSIIPPFEIKWGPDGIEFEPGGKGYDNAGPAMTNTKGKIIWSIIKAGKFAGRVGKVLVEGGDGKVDQIIEEALIAGADLLDIPLEEFRDALGYQRPPVQQNEPVPDPGGQIVLGVVDP